MKFYTVANMRQYNLLIVLLQNKSDKVRLEGKPRNGKKREELRRDRKISSNMGGWVELAQFPVIASVGGSPPSGPLSTPA